GASVTAPRLPHDRRLELQLPDAASIAEVELQWSPVGKPDDIVGGSTLRFSPGSAPSPLVAHVRLPDGRYDLDVHVRRRGAARADPAHHRTLTLGEGHVMTLRFP